MDTEKIYRQSFTNRALQFHAIVRTPLIFGINPRLL
jgi:hypothetical protein